MKRILYISTISRFLRDFLLPHARHFREQGWQVDALCNAVDEYPICQKYFDHIWEVDWSRHPLQLQNFLHAPQVVKKIVQREGYDLVHVHTPVASLVTRYALRGRQGAGAPKVIYTAHGFHFHAEGSPLQNSLFLQIEKCAGRWTDYLVVINQEDYAAAERHKVVPPESLVYMPGIGVDTRFYNRKSVPPIVLERLRREIGLTEKHPLITMIAEFNPGKRHADALKAFALVTNRKAHLALAGIGPLVPAMEELAQSLGIAKRVHFLGFRNDVPAILCASTAALLPSEREGLPRCIMESFSCGVPVIGANIRGIRELVTASCGFTVPVGDIDGMAQAMNWLIAHPAEAQEMGEHGRQRMSAYDVNNIISLHEELYATALGYSTSALVKVA